MPLGKRYDEAGLMHTDGRTLFLERDDGGRWRLDADRSARSLIGRRVRVVGIRSDFDVLDVETLTAC